MEDYEILIEEEIEKNNLLINKFGEWLVNSGLSLKTIQKHIDNIEFYLNHYIVYYCESLNDNIICSAEESIDYVDEFLGYWFIKKAMWSDESSIKSNITTFKKFYKFLNSIGLVSKEELKELNKTIKENKQEWIDTVNRYNNPNVDFDDIWDF